MAVWSQILIGSTLGLRLDAEYYQPSYLNLSAKLKCLQPVAIDTFAFVTDGIHGSPQWVEEGGVTYLSAMCVKDNYFDLTKAGQISQEQNKLNPRTQAQVGDVLLTTVGTIGNAAVVYEDILPANMDRHLGIIRIRSDQKDIDPYYLATFLNSKFGRFQTLREATGNVQLNLFIDKIKKLLVPKGDKFNEVGRVTRSAYDKLRESKSLYTEAEALLLQQLGISNAAPHPNTYTSMFSNASRSHRLDAEYFHPEKTHIVEQLSYLPGKTIADSFDLIVELVNPPPYDTGERVHNYDLSNALKFFLSDDVEPMPTHELGSTKKRFRKGDVVVSRLRSYLKEIAVVVTDDEFDCVGSSEFIVLRPKSQTVCSELLLVYLRCPYVQKILKWCQNGSNHPRFDEDEILAIRLPDRILDIQEAIVDLIKKGIACQYEAQTILDEAKRQVEEMIERFV